MRTQLWSPIKRTIKFKTAYPNYSTFIDLVKKYNPTIGSNFTQVMFNYVELFIGNSFLKFDTIEKNNAWIALKFDRLWTIKLREDVLYNKTLPDLLGGSQTSERTLFLVNRTDTAVDNKFIDNRLTDNLTSNASIADQFETLQNQIKLDNPMQKFYKNFCNSIVYSIQTQTGDDIC